MPGRGGRRARGERAGGGGRGRAGRPGGGLGIRRAGADVLVLERADAVAASWRARHDHLRLNAHRMFSHQPGMRIPRRCGPFPSRDDYVAYLERHAAGMRIRLGAAVRRIDPAAAGWVLDLGGQAITTAHAVIATGPDAEPVRPAWPGSGGFPGTLIHAGQFRNVADVAGRSVLVAGPGKLRYRPAESPGPQQGFPAVAVDALGHEHLSDAAGRRPAAPGQRGHKAPAATGPGRQPADTGPDSVRRSHPARVSPPRPWRIQPGCRRRGDGGTGRRLRRGAEGQADQHEARDRAVRLVSLDRRGMPPGTGGPPAPARPGLWFFGLDRSIYGNMHIHCRQARQLARLITR
jgi:hypothetical protein